MPHEQAGNHRARHRDEHMVQKDVQVLPGQLTSMMGRPMMSSAIITSSPHMLAMTVTMPLVAGTRRLI